MESFIRYNNIIQSELDFAELLYGVHCSLRWWLGGLGPGRKGGTNWAMGSGTERVSDFSTN